MLIFGKILQWQDIKNGSQSQHTFFLDQSQRTKMDEKLLRKNIMKITFVIQRLNTYRFFQEIIEVLDTLRHLFLMIFNNNFYFFIPIIKKR